MLHLQQQQQLAAVCCPLWVSLLVSLRPSVGCSPCPITGPCLHDQNESNTGQLPTNASSFLVRPFRWYCVNIAFKITKIKSWFLKWPQGNCHYHEDHILEDVSEVQSCSQMRMSGWDCWKMYRCNQIPVLNPHSRKTKIGVQYAATRIIIP